ncbi:MAG: response regulator [Ignavibacteriales bacterium]|nr:response regulator [Ignavibacteriales bacterium]
MMLQDGIKILCIEAGDESFNRIESHLNRYEKVKFTITRRRTGQSGIEELEKNSNYDIVLMHHNLPGLDGLRTLSEFNLRNDATPVVFLAVHEDTGLAVEAMKLGAADFLTNEDISSPVFPQTLVGIVEKTRLNKEFSQLETKKRRLEAMQEFVLKIASRIESPLVEMRTIASELLQQERDEKAQKYLQLIAHNLDRLEEKMKKLKNLQDDKTVQYIKDIKMVDLS